MGQVRHGSATTAHAVRATTIASFACNAELGAWDHPKMVAKWRKQVIDSPCATPPVTMSHRAGDTSCYLDLIQRLIRKMYAEKPAWLKANNLAAPTQNP